MAEFVAGSAVALVAMLVGHWLCRRAAGAAGGDRRPFVEINNHEYHDHNNEFHPPWAEGEDDAWWREGRPAPWDEGPSDD